jgi:bifunctional non-homologous end joining protein LigD
MKHMSEFVITRHSKMQKARNNAGNSLTFGFSGRIVSVISTLLRSAEHEDIEEDFSIAVHENPVENPPKIPEQIQWVQAQLVREVAYAEWTEDERLRQTTFLGWRDDKSPKEMILE